MSIEATAGSSRPADYGDAAAELRAATQTCALVDLSDCTRLLATGPDLLGLLQRLSTNDVAALEPGSAISTVLTTAKGRIVARLSLQHGGDQGVLIGAGAGQAEAVKMHLAKYTFAERTGLSDVSASSRQFAIVGPQSAAALERLGIEPAPTAQSSAQVEVAGRPVWLTGHDGQGGAGAGLVLIGNPSAIEPDAEAVAGALVAAVDACAGRRAGDAAWRGLQLLQGRPVAGAELSEQHNPLEVGLWDAVSFTKGCYVGQEVVARLNHYDKVSRELVGLRWPPDAQLPPAPFSLRKGEQEVGRCTRWAYLPGREECVGIALVRKKYALIGGRVVAESSGAEAAVVALPFDCASDHGTV